MNLTNFKKLLKEEFEDGHKYKGSYVEIYRNPTSKEIGDILKKFGEKLLRGVIRKDGEVFVIDYEDAIHDNIVNLLERKDLLKPYSFWYMEEESLEKFLCIDRQESGIWKPAESYSFDIPEQQLKYYKSKMEIKGYHLS